MGFFIGVFILATLLILYGYYIGKKYTIKQAKENGIRSDQSEEKDKKYKYF